MALWRAVAAVVLLVACAVASAPTRAEIAIANVSREPARRFYSELNRLLAERSHAERGERISVYRSPGGPGKKTGSIAFVPDAGVVAFARTIADLSAWAAEVQTVRFTRGGIPDQMYRPGS